MRSELITGNLLLRHGFWFSGRSGYRLDLPVAEGQFGLAWESKTGLFLYLKEAHKEAVPEEDPPKLLHRLDHVKTLESLQQVYGIFTGQPLIKVSDELYKQQVKSRREQDPEELGMEIYREKFDSPVRYMGVFTKEITPELLEKQGFTSRNGRMEARLFCKYDPQDEKDLVLLSWNETEGLTMEVYREERLVGTIFLHHSDSIKELLEVKVLLTPRPKMSDPEFLKKKNYLEEVWWD